MTAEYVMFSQHSEWSEVPIKTFHSLKPSWLSWYGTDAHCFAHLFLVGHTCHTHLLFLRIPPFAPSPLSPPTLSQAFSGPVCCWPAGTRVPVNALIALWCWPAANAWANWLCLLCAESPFSSPAPAFTVLLFHHILLSNCHSFSLSLWPHPSTKGSSGHSSERRMLP